MLALACILLVLSGANAQSICHSNHQQQTEDQVIERVVSRIDNGGNGDGIIDLWEMYVFFDALLGKNSIPPGGAAVISAMSEDELVQLTVSLSGTLEPLTKQEFVHAWHAEFHDSIAFVEYAFDILIDENRNGVIDPEEIHLVKDHARTRYDLNGDGKLQKSELAAFFESVYKSDNCVHAVG